MADHTETLESKLKGMQKKGDGEYHDILWYAVQSLKDNAMQTTWQPPEDCVNKQGCSAGGCASCSFKCGRAAEFSSTSSEIPGDDPFAERNPVNMPEPPLPETTFPFLQIAACLVACVAGCYFAEHLIMSLLH